MAPLRGKIWGLSTISVISRKELALGISFLAGILQYPYYILKNTNYFLI